MGVDQLCLWSHFAHLKCIWFVCVPQGFYQMHHDNLSCSAFTAPSKIEGLILHQWWLRKGCVCGCVWMSVRHRETRKEEKDRKQLEKKQNGCKSGNGSGLSDNISISERWNISEWFFFCAYDPVKSGLKLGYLIPMCVNSPVCVYAMNKPSIWHVKRDVLY